MFDNYYDEPEYFEPKVSWRNNDNFEEPKDEILDDEDMEFHIRAELGENYR